MSRPPDAGARAEASLSPPWVLFVDDGKPVAILPAGRPGEVANVSHLSMRQAQEIVRLANRIHDAIVEAKLRRRERDIVAMVRDAGRLALEAEAPSSPTRRSGRS